MGSLGGHCWGTVSHPGSFLCRQKDTKCCPTVRVSADSLFVCLCLSSLCLSVCPSDSVFLPLFSVFVCLFLSLSIFPMSLSISISLTLSLSLSLYLSYVCLYFCLSLAMSLSVSVFLSSLSLLNVSVCLFLCCCLYLVCLSAIYLFCLSVTVSLILCLCLVCLLSVCLSVSLSPPEEDVGEWDASVDKLAAGFLKLLEIIDGTQVFLWRVLEIHIIKFICPVVIWFTLQEVSWGPGGTTLGPSRWASLGSPLPCWFFEANRWSFPPCRRCPS